MLSKDETIVMASPVTSTNRLPANIVLRHNLKPGDIGYLTYLHGVLYAEEQGWDQRFEAYVAGPLAEFAKSHSARERIWIVEHDAKIAGSIAIVEASKELAQLRWFLLHPDLRGRGVGRILIEEAITFCKANDYSSIFLWTVSALTVAAKLYQSVGFQLREETTQALWGTIVMEQRYDLKLL